MTSTVSSHSGRHWLESQIPATTAFEQAASTIPDAPAKCIGIADLSTLKVAPMQNAAQNAPSQPISNPAAEPTFATRSIYNQLHGTSEAPAVEHMNSIVLPEMNTSQSTPSGANPADHQIVFVNIPNVTSTSDVDDDAQMKVIDAPDLDTIKAAKELAKEESGQISNLVDSIFERFPLAASTCLLYTSPSPRDQRGSRMPSSA